jgi:hypothetical protein
MRNYLQFFGTELQTRVQKGSPAEYGAGLKIAIDRGWIWKHKGGTYVKLTQ